MLDGLLDDSGSTFPDSYIPEGTQVQFHLHFVNNSNDYFDASVSYGDGGGDSWNSDPSFDEINADIDHVVDDNGTISADASTQWASYGWPYAGHWDLATVYNVAPTATLSAGSTAVVSEAFEVALTDASDPSGADTTAGFRYSFATDSGELATSYSEAGTDSSDEVFFGSSGEHTVYARIFDKDGGYTDYDTSVDVSASFGPPLDPTIDGTGDNDTIIVRRTSGYTNRIDVKINSGSWNTMIMPEDSTLFINGGYGSDTITIESLADTIERVQVNGFEQRPVDSYGNPEAWLGDNRTPGGPFFYYDNDTLNLGGDSSSSSVGTIAGFPEIDFDGGDPYIIDTFNQESYFGLGGNDPVNIFDHNTTADTNWSITSSTVARDTTLIAATGGFDPADDGSFDYGLVIFSGSGNDTISAEIAYAFDFHSGNGADEVDLFQVFDSRIDTGAGNDTVSIDESSGITLTTGNGSDELTVLNIDSSSLSTGNDADLVNLIDAGDTDISTGAGDDTIRITGGTFDDGKGINDVGIDAGDDDDAIEINNDDDNTATTDRSLYSIGLMTVVGGNGSDTLTIDDRDFDPNHDYGTWDSTYQLYNSGLLFSSAGRQILFSGNEKVNFYMHEGLSGIDGPTHPTLRISDLADNFDLYINPEAGDTSYIRVDSTGTNTDVHIRAVGAGTLDMKIGDGDPGSGGTDSAAVIIDGNSSASPNIPQIQSLKILEDGTVTFPDGSYTTAVVNHLAMYHRSTLRGTLDIGHVSTQFDDFTSYVVTFPSSVRTETSDGTGIPALQTYLYSGLNSGGLMIGDWLGLGIRSSAAAAVYAADNDGSTSGLTGIGYKYDSVATHAYLLKYTWLGDSDLDGDVDATDLGHLSAHWNTGYDSGTSTWADYNWAEGDFNYGTDPNNPDVDIKDINFIGINWGKTATQLAAL